MSATTTTNVKQPLNHSEGIFFNQWTLILIFSQQLDRILVFPQTRNKEAVKSDLLGLVGLLLRVPGVPVVHSSLLGRQGPEQTLYERGRGCL